MPFDGALEALMASLNDQCDVSLLDCLLYVFIILLLLLYDCIHV